VCSSAVKCVLSHVCGGVCVLSYTPSLSLIHPLSVSLSLLFSVTHTHAHNTSDAYDHSAQRVESKNTRRENTWGECARV